MVLNAKEQIGLLVELKAKPGKEAEVKKLLSAGENLVDKEPETLSWFAFQLDDRSFGIFNTFQNEHGRKEHLSGEVAKTLLAKADELLEDFDLKNSVKPVDIITCKKNHGEEKVGLWGMLKAKTGKSVEVENLLKSSQQIAQNETGTLSWYAVKLAEDYYAVLDTFSNDAERNVHMKGKIVDAFKDKAPDILERFEISGIQKMNILASKQ